WKNKDRPAWEIVPPGGAMHWPALCFSPDGKQVVILFQDNRVELWDGPGGKRVRELPKLPSYLHHCDSRGYCSIEWWGIDQTPDGKRLALFHRGPTGELGGRIIDPETGKDICSLVPQSMPETRGLHLLRAD